MVKVLNNSLSQFFTSTISGTESLSQAFKKMAASIIAEILRVQAMEAIKSFFPSLFKSAHGNQFSGGTGLAHGIYTQPTFFKFARGASFGRTGVLGEAGAEAILPLRRDSAGDLGVKASAVNVVVNNNASGTEATATTDENGDITVTIERVKASIMRDISRGGNAISSVFQSTYNLNRGFAR